MCFFNHLFVCVAVYHYRDISWVPEGEKGAESTRTTLRCKKCGKIKTEAFYGAGFLSIDQLNGE